MARLIAKHGVLVLVVASLAACGPTIGNAIAVDKYQDSSEPVTNDYVINTGDVLNIAVWEQPTLSGPQIVRPDGKINLPLINEIQAAGKTPAKLKADLEAAFKTMVLNPQVVVGVSNPKNPSIAVMGEVAKQGPVELTPGMGVGAALAAAGGLGTFAHKDRIYVQRKNGDAMVTIHFTYDAILNAEGKAAQFKLRQGDTIVVR